MTTWYYQHSGFSIISELQLPEWNSFETAPISNSPDITIRWQSAPCAGATPETRLSADQYCFFIPDAGFYRVDRNGKITINAVPDPDLKKVRVFLLGTAWGALCHLQGILTLHAGVVQAGNSAIAFCGASGAGKSSMVARLTTLGYPLISDDLCRVTLTDTGYPAIYRSAQRLKLWRDALTVLEYEALGREQDHARMDKFHIPILHRPEGECSPVTGIYLLTWGDLSCRRLIGLDALQRLVATATYRGELLEPMGQIGGHWIRCLELVKRVPIWELSRPRKWAALEDTVALVFEKQALANKT